MTESRFKCAAIKVIKKELPGCWVYHATDRWVSGIPDLFILYQGVFAAVELKFGNNTATRLQEYTLAKLSAAGAITQICRDNATENGLDQIRSVCAAIKAGGV